MRPIKGRLSQKDATIEAKNAIIEYLNSQLADKDDEINKLRKELNFSRAKLKVLQKLTDILISPFDVICLLDLLLGIVTKAINAEGGMLLLLDKENDELVFKMGKGLSREDLITQRLKVGQGIVGQVAKIGKPKVGIAFEKEFIELKGQKRSSARSFLCVPLKIKRNVIGVVEVINKIGVNKNFDQEDVDFLSSISNQMAIIIENAKLFHNLQEKIKEQKSLIEMTRIITSEKNFKDLLSKTVRLTKEVMNAEAASLLLVDEASSTLRFEVAYGPAGEEIKKFSLKMGEGIAGWVAKKGRLLLVKDTSKDKRFFTGLDEQTGFKTKSILCAPLKVGEKVIGVIEVINKLYTTHFADKDVELFETLSKQVAIAIDNLKIYKE